MPDKPACLATKNVHRFPLPGGECRGVNHHDGCHGHIDTSRNRCHAHVPVSLLDQIHAARSQAEANGQHELARWLTAHADEACPAAIAQGMELSGANDALDEWWHEDHFGDKCEVGGVGMAHSEECVSTAFRDGYAAGRKAIANLRAVAEVAEDVVQSFDRFILNHTDIRAYAQIGSRMAELRAALVKVRGGK